MVIALPFIIGLVWLMLNLAALKRIKIGNHREPTISVLIPLRNEAKNIPALMDSLHRVTYEKAQFLFYDDESTDQTAFLIQQRLSFDHRFQFLEGTALQGSWRGKTYACQQLADRATGDILVWIDADVTLHHETLDAIANMFEKPIDALSGFPRFYMRNWLEKLLTPLLHFFVHFHLPIYLANTSTWPSATAASGAFIAIRRTAYNEIGGHAAVKEHVVEDVALFRELKKHRKRAMLYNVSDFIACAMYDNTKETWRGFQKNCFRGINHSYTLGLFIVVFYMIYFIGPVIGLIVGIITQQWNYIVPFIGITLMRLLSDYAAKQQSLWSFFMPISAFAYSVLMCVTMWQTAQQKTMYWKGRKL